MENWLESDADCEEQFNAIKKIQSKGKKSNRYFIELKIVTESLQELRRLEEWSKYLGFYSDGVVQEENGLYWTFLNINNDLIFKHVNNEKT